MSWPMTENEWAAHAARCVAHYPLMATNWTAHRDFMNSRRLTAEAAEPPPPPADEPPLSPEMEETLF